MVADHHLPGPCQKSKQDAEADHQTEEVARPDQVAMACFYTTLGKIQLLFSHLKEERKATKANDNIGRARRSMYRSVSSGSK